MLSQRVRAAASAAALAAFVLLVGTAAFLAAQDDPSPPPTTTTTTTTTTTIPLSDFANAIATSLQGSLEVAITPEEATCVANAILEVLPTARLERLEQLPAPFAALSEGERDRLVRGVVQCVPPESAAAILGSASTTAPPVDLPDEG
jgi:hypothetical protein